MTASKPQPSVTGTAPPGRRRRLALVTVALALIVALGLAELVARRTYGPGFENVVDPWLDHAYRPLVSFRQSWGDARTLVHTNSLGWKDARPDHRVAKSAAPLRRIVFLGDSFTEGLGIADEATLVGVAGRRLGPGFEVLNGGQASYSPLLEYQRLKRFLAAGYRADAVVLLVDASDVQDEIDYSSRYRFAADGEPVRFAGLRYQPILRWLYDSSALARSLRRLPADLARQDDVGRFSTAPLPPRVAEELAGPAPLTDARLFTMSGDTFRVLRANWMGHAPSLAGWAEEGLRSLFANVLRTRKLARQENLHLLVVIYPGPTVLYTREDPAYYRLLRATFPRWYQDREAVYCTRPSPLATAYEERLTAFCRENGIPLLDLIPDFQRVARWHELYIPGDVHFNAAGHRLAGERIAREIGLSFRDPKRP